MANIKIINSSVNDDIYAVQAGPEDEDAVRELILATARWLNSMGSIQWGGLLQGEDSHDLKGAIARGEVFAFRKEGGVELAGAVILQQEPSEWDRKLWGEAEAGKGNAVFLHRLVVNRQFSGKGLGGDIMAWVERGIQFPGKDRMKLDCIANNEKLNRFYKQCGYTYKGEASGWSIYEKRLPDVKVH
ncbi:GNAT family N-acetyltransferase [Paenibacillus sp. BIHB 4019]|uniref:GNAT family N-acetyltransferase n=1 Tax=Paenibacillus sp. BIHB 4019 TaxID=1870819 RepID=A0A1B2DMW0_9BACL|nr:GNAT family N-acetyltransferase [Paenibacillus sp. BIHB 4019]ANY69043.1 GNAT family N-acetyltransferase [Paenibacillus sp. BIHB 4019]